MQTLIDSHCHLNFIDDAAAAIERAQQTDVTHMLCIGVDATSSQRALQLANEHPSVWASAGLHPEAAAGVDPSVNDLDWLTKLLTSPRTLAIGETGLDHFQAPGAAQVADQAKAWQLYWFEAHLKLARDTQLPVIVHTRGAPELTMNCIANSGCRQGVIHCFTEDLATAQAALALGFYISFSGIVTFKNAAALRAVLQQVPLDRLLIETDSPWLAPVPHRGKANEPALLPHVLETFASVRDETPAELAQAITENFYRLFAKASA